jgi:hypothetical protein
MDGSTPPSNAGDLLSEVVVEEFETPFSWQQEIEEQFAQKRAIRQDLLSFAEIIDALKNGTIILDQIVNIGTKIWNLVEKGKPKVEIAFDYAHALPAGVANSAQLEGFSDMTFRSYRVYGKNLYGINVYDITYTTVHQYGGNLIGKGNYLTNVTVLPSKVSVSWGYDVSVTMREVGTSNMGSMENPKAGLLLELQTHVRTVMKDETTHNLFNFKGDSPLVTMTP